MKKSEPNRHSQLLASLTGAAIMTTPVAAQVWSEEFDAGPRPNESVWDYDLADPGWHNNELQKYTNNLENVRVEDGHLIITARQTENGGFSSGRIKTQNRLTFQYGTLEARIKIPDLADGLWPAFWTLGNNISTVSWPGCGEIDVLEMGHHSGIADGVANRRVHSTVHWKKDGKRVYEPYHTVREEDLSEGFHVYRLEWTPTSITTRIDGEKILSFDIAPEAGSGRDAFHHPHFLLLNLAVGGNFPGIRQSDGITAPLPAELVVDWVRIYDNGFTQLGGSAIEDETADGEAASDDTAQDEADGSEPDSTEAEG